MEETGVKRKLTVILAADVEGYLSFLSVSIFRRKQQRIRAAPLCNIHYYVKPCSN